MYSFTSAFYYRYSRKHSASKFCEIFVISRQRNVRITGIFPHTPDGGKSHPVNFATPPSLENQNTPPTGVHSSENRKRKCEIFFRLRRAFVNTAFQFR